MSGERILLIEPDPQGGPALAGRLRDFGLRCELAQSGKEAWQRLATARPDLMLLAAETPDLSELMRRLRDEYMALAPAIVAMTSVGSPRISSDDNVVRAVVMRPAEVRWLGDLAAQTTRGEIAVSPERLREMLRLTTLGAEMQESLDQIARRLKLIYGVASVAIVANAAERQWVGTSAGAVALTEWPRLWQLCAQAVDVRSPLIVSSADGPQTRIAAALRTAQNEIVGAICLFASGARLAATEAFEALEDLSARIGAELAWRSIHSRVSGERDKLRETAMIDPLTGIASRAALDHTLSAEIARSHRTKSPVTLAIINVEALRVINDRYGHLAGDAVLRHVARTASDLVRAHDLVGRVGGDEIAVVLGDTDTKEANEVVGRILKVLENKPFKNVDESEISIEVRAGLAEYGKRDADATAWLARASEATIFAKQAGDRIAIARGNDRPQTSRPEVRFEPGTTLAGMYEIAHEISRGAMGVVYRAEDLGLSRPVAIKMLRPDLVREPGVVDRFREEAGILASLSHENLVRIYSLVEADDDVFFVMELVEGVSLHSVVNDFISRNRYLSRERVGTIVKQVASALDAMHNAGVMHRDVKPSNVVLDRARDRAVLLDVGLARRVGSQSDAAGTPGYVAPESFRGGTETPATDVYGLAATAYTLLVNRAPFGTADDVRDILRRQLSTSPKIPSGLRADITSETDAVLAKAMRLEPQDRYLTAGAFANSLVDSFSGVNPDVALSEVDSLPEYLRVERGSSAPGGTASSSAPATQANSRGAGGEFRTSETLTFIPALARPGSSTRAPLSRGILFRCAAKLLETAPDAKEAVLLANPSLAGALSPHTAPGGWLPAGQFIALLEAIDLTGHDRNAFALELGSLAVQLSFRSFYPSSPESLSPSMTLSAADVLWRRYHSWGAIDIEVVDENEAMLGFRESPSPFVCTFIRGWLARIAIESGGTTPAVQHPSCRHNGDPLCSFVVTWATP